jgi:ATP-dependent helicase/nuclease subunit A
MIGKNLKTMNKNILPDAKARKRIESDFETNFFIEAGAGSGKTESLVKRMVGLLRYGHANLENVAAVTFTKKASAELRERLQVELEKLYCLEIPEEEKHRVNKALKEFERASVNTIHAFCADILRERPVEAELDPEFQSLEEEENVINAKNFWPFFLEKQASCDSESLERLEALGVSASNLNDIYVELIRYPDVEKTVEEVPRPSFPETRAELEKELRAIRNKMPNKEPSPEWDTLQKMVVGALNMIDNGDISDDIFFISVLKKLDKNTGVVQRRWNSKENALECKAIMENIQSDIVKPFLKEWKEYLHKPLLDFTLKGVDSYAEWRKERSLLNFQDLLMQTALLLRNNNEVRTYFKKKITHLMVDEFQDTDPIQAEIIMLLAGIENSENNWRKTVPRKGALFIVGDPKQSIYRFRRADIDIYNITKSLIEKNGGETLQLVSNFRSLQPIKDITETVFKDVFPTDSSKYQASFVPMHIIRPMPEAAKLAGIFKQVVPEVEKNRPIEVAKEDAKRIATWIKLCIDRQLQIAREDKEKIANINANAQPGDFMILTKRKKNLSLYAIALENLGIPYEISGGEKFRLSNELYELYKLFSALADSKNSAALLAVLRGQFFGVSDRDLYSFVKQGGSFKIFEDTKEEHPVSIKEAFKKLKIYSKFIHDLEPLAAIETIIEDTGIIPLAASLDMGATRCGNIFKSINLLRQYRIQTGAGFVEIVKYMGELRNTDKEEMGLFPATSKAVRIMNLHKAKGLEANIVILADPLDDSKEHPITLSVKRHEDKSLGYFCFTQPSSSYSKEIIAQPTNWESKADEEKKYETAEIERLDYVAITRARNAVVISAYNQGDRRRTWNAFSEYIQDAEELEIPPYKPLSKETFNIAKEQLIEETTEIENKINMLKESSYKISSVTDSTHKDTSFSESLGQGIKWGIIVHKAIELCGKGKADNLKTFVPVWLKEEGISEKHIEKLIAEINNLMQSELWDRFQKAKIKYFEVPLSLWNKESNELVSGIIDALFKENNEWVIVDWKTDDFDRDSSRKSAYKKQLEYYAKSWEKITGEKVKETLLQKVSLN